MYQHWLIQYQFSSIVLILSSVDAVAAVAVLTTTNAEALPSFSYQMEWMLLTVGNEQESCTFFHHQA